MSFTSFSFLIFFPLTLLIVWLVPGRRQNAALLAASWAFYACNTPAWLPVLVLDSAATWALCRRMDKAAGARRRRRLWGALAVNIGLLAGMRALGFALRGLDPGGAAALFFDAVGLSGAAHGRFSLILPLGVSFFTVQSIGYAVDVFRKKAAPEKSFLTFALFVSFFPLISSGPIARAGGLLAQLRRPRTLKTDRAAHALLTFALGFFSKTAAADLLAVFANAVFDNVRAYTGLTLTLGLLAYGLQLYFDFSGYSLMALATAELLGLRLEKNFDTPYFSRSVREFWGRWHISFSTWLRDYVYIPLGGNRKGKARKYLNLLVTFLVSGLWHGAGATYFVWGLLHAAYQIAGDATNGPRGRLYAALRVKRGGRLAAVWQCACTFCLVHIAWAFFRARTVGDAVYLLVNQWKGVSPAALWADAGAIAASFNAKPLLSAAFAAFTLLGVVFAAALDCLRRFRAPDGDLSAFLLTRPLVWRWLCYFALLGCCFVGFLMNNGYFATAANFLYNNF